jgi:hypothetical protein
MTMPLPDPRAPPSAGDKATHGKDCARHPLLGCIISQGSPAGPQARSYLWSRYEATRQNIAGRDRDLDLSPGEYKAALAELEAWEAAGNKVEMPAPIMPASFRRG